MQQEDRQIAIARVILERRGEDFTLNPKLKDSYEVTQEAMEDAKIILATLFPTPITLTYKNHKGETAERQISPLTVYWGSTKWHTEQWLLKAFDHGKRAIRDFALAGFGDTEEVKRVRASRDRLSGSLNMICVAAKAYRGSDEGVRKAFDKCAKIARDALNKLDAEEGRGS